MNFEFCSSLNKAFKAKYVNTVEITEQNPEVEEQVWTVPEVQEQVSEVQEQVSENTEQVKNRKIN